jgi:hypothetical protein
MSTEAYRRKYKAALIGSFTHFNVACWLTKAPASLLRMGKTTRLLFDKPGV